MQSCFTGDTHLGFDASPHVAVGEIDDRAAAGGAKALQFVHRQVRVIQDGFDRKRVVAQVDHDVFVGQDDAELRGVNGPEHGHGVHPPCYRTRCRWLRARQFMGSTIQRGGEGTDWQGRMMNEPGHTLSRRTLLRGAALSLGAVAGAGLLQACGPAAPSAAPTSAPAAGTTVPPTTAAKATSAPAAGTSE